MGGSSPASDPAHRSATTQRSGSRSKSAGRASTKQCGHSGALLRSGTPGFSGRWYSTDGVVLEPPPATPGGPPIWLGSWGSDAGLRRVERLADGWLASGYNITPPLFAERARALPEGFPNAVGTLWMYITESPAEAERVLSEVLAPVLGRDPEALAKLALPIGSAEQCAERLQAWADAGVQRAFVWPLSDELRQIELLAEAVRA